MSNNKNNDIVQVSVKWFITAVTCYLLTGLFAGITVALTLFGYRESAALMLGVTVAFGIFGIVAIVRAKCL